VTEKAYDILGHNGSISAATHHSCSECTHAYKQSINLTADDMDIDAADVKMAVLDGIVMGPTVSFDLFIIFKKDIIYIYSIVHLIIVKVHWPMHVEAPSVHIMNMSLEIDAVSVTA